MPATILEGVIDFLQILVTLENEESDQENRGNLYLMKKHKNNNGRVWIRVYIHNTGRNLIFHSWSIDYKNHWVKHPHATNWIRNKLRFSFDLEITKKSTNRIVFIVVYSTTSWMRGKSSTVIVEPKIEV